MEDRLYAYSLDSGALTAIPLPSDIVEQLNVTKSGNLYLLARGAVKPLNIYRYADGAWSMITKNVLTGLTDEDMVTPEVVTYPSFDGMEIEALLFRAKDHVANGYTVFGRMAACKPRNASSSVPCSSIFWPKVITSSVRTSGKHGLRQPS